MQKTNKLKKCIFWLAVFTAMFIFFAYMHPLYIFDADDWTYISERRWGLPMRGIWNPARVLPETLMSATGDLGAFVIQPLLADYIQALMFACAAVVSGVITLYVHAFSKLLSEKMELKGAANYTLSAFFLLLHFLIFKKQPAWNRHLFFTTNVTCVFYYVIPALLCATLVMFLIRTDVRKPDCVQGGFLLLATYLCIFSNLYDSVVLASYAGLCLLRALPYFSKKKTSLRAYVKEQGYYLCVIAFFLVQCMYERSGGRASDMGGGINLAETLAKLMTVPAKLNYWFVMISAGVILFLIMYLIYSRGIGRGNCEKKHSSPIKMRVVDDKDNRTNDENSESDEVDKNVNLSKKVDQKKMQSEPNSATEKTDCEMCNLSLISLWGFVTTLIYLVLLSAVVSPKYIVRTDVLIAAAFYFLLFLMVAVAFLVRRIPQLFYAVPLVCFVSLTVLTSGLRIFAEPNVSDLTGRQVYALNTDFVRQVVESEKAGANSVELQVPQYETEDNWPQSTYFGNRMARTLYRHGITDRLMDITVCPNANYQPEVK